MIPNGQTYQYFAEIARKDDNVGFGRRPVPASFLEPARDQVVFLAQRRGVIGPDPTGVCVREEPVFDVESTGKISGFRMAVERDGRQVTHEFELAALEPFAREMAIELLKSKQIDGKTDIKLRAFAVLSPPMQNDSGEGDVSAHVQRDALPLLDGRLEDHIADAVWSGPEQNGDYPVAVPESVLEKAREFVFERNQEKGMWVVGNLFRRWEPEPEIFCVIHSVFESRGTTHERFSIDFSTETFTHAEQQLSLRRNRLGRKHDLLVGFYHTHPFLPSILDGKENCPACELRPHCTLTSSFFSQRDQAFHAAFFGSVPYAVEFVLGLTPREEFDLKMFCVDGGRFRERGFYRIADVPAEIAV